MLGMLALCFMRVMIHTDLNQAVLRSAYRPIYD